MKFWRNGPGSLKSVCLMLLILLSLQGFASATYEPGTPLDKVVALKLETYNKALKDPANPLWFLKFYAPWCGHCKRMAPVLDAVAPQVRGKMAIGKIDCTAAEKKLCDQQRVRGYPTLKFALDGEVYDYPGSRDEQSLIQFATKMSGPAVKIVHSYDEAMKYAASSTDEGVAFVGYDVEAQGTGDDLLSSTTLAQVFSQVARKQKAFGHFLWMAPEARGIEHDTIRFVSRIEEGVEPLSWTLASSVNPDTTQLIQFVKEQSLPTVSTLGPSNFRNIGNRGRPLVISVIDMGNEELVNAVKEHLLKFIASAAAATYKKQYYFCLMDGTKWGRFLEQFNVRKEDNPQVFMLEVPTNKFWQNSSFTTVGEFLNGVTNGTIPEEVSPGHAGAKGFLKKLQYVFVDNFPWSLITLLVLIFGLIFICIPGGDDEFSPTDRFVDEFDDEDEDDQEPTDDQKEGDGKPGEATESKKDK